MKKINFKKLALSLGYLTFFTMAFSKNLKGKPLAETKKVRLPQIIEKKIEERQKQSVTDKGVEKSPLTTDDSLGFQILGGILSKRGEDFFENARNKKSVLLFKINGKLKYYKNGDNFTAKYNTKTVTFTLHHIYNIYHMKLSYQKGRSKKFLEVYKVGFSSKKSKFPQKVKKEIVKKKPFGDKYSEMGFERDFSEISGKIRMTDSFRETIKKNLSNILMQASASPVVKDGEIIGFVLENIEKDSLYEKAGFQNKDIITSINGIPLTNAAVAIKILNNLKEADNINLEFLREENSYSVSVSID